MGQSRAHIKDSSQKSLLSFSHPFDFNAKDEEQAIRHALRIATHVSPFHAASYYTVEVVNGERIAEYLYSEGYIKRRTLLFREESTHVTARSDTIIARILMDELPLYIDGSDDLVSQHAPVRDAAPFESCYIPIHIHRPSGKQLVGILVAYNFEHKAGAISTQAITLLESAVYQLQISLEHRDALLQLESSLSLQNKLYNSIRSICETRTVEEAVEALFDCLKFTFHVRASSLSVLDLQSRKIRIIAEFGWGSECHNPEREPATYAVWLQRCGESRHSTRFDDIAHSELDTSIAAQLTKCGIQSCVLTPLLSAGNIMGFQSCYWQYSITPQIEQAIYELSAVFAGVYSSRVDTKRALDSKIQSLATLGIAMESRDVETFGHTQRVVAYMDKFMKQLGLAKEHTDAGIVGAYLHDIGKISIPDAILLKPARLTPDERVIIERHAVKGYEMAKRLRFVDDEALQIILSHHERWDGQGYPHKISGESIPLLPRMFSLIDVYDALTHARPYKPAWPAELAMEYLKANAGTQFDPALTAKFLDLLGAESEAARKHGESDAKHFTNYEEASKVNV